MSSMTTLRRPRYDRVLAGVCAGLGRYFGIDPVLVRLAWVLLTFFGGSGILFYLIAWLVIPDDHGRRALTPLVLLLIFFIAVPVLCFMVTLPFQLLGWIF